MTRIDAVVLTLGLAALAGCATDPGVTAFARTWNLVAVDGKALPVQASFPDGFQLDSELLTFPGISRPRTGEPVAGLVVITQAYSGGIAGGHQSAMGNYAFEIRDASLRINLCPLGALCIMPTELIGTIGSTEAILTHYLGGQAKSVYRFVVTPTMPD